MRSLVGDFVLQCYCCYSFLTSLTLAVVNVFV